MKIVNGTMVGQLVLVSFLLFFAAGCNSGSTSGDNSAPVATSLSLPSADTFGGTSDSSTGSDTTGGTETGGETVANVHNPEPGSMILLGIGLAGAALRRKRSKNA